jgi:uncharacterized membrane protein YdbT with pleckstrin-like domain
MQISEKQNKVMHSMLPIDDDEEILSIYKHHWFAYVSQWVIAIILVIVILGLAAFMVTFIGGEATNANYKMAIMGGAVALSALVAIFTLVPAWLKSQEFLVLTDEAILQTLQPALFAAKTSQLSLQHINDVTVRKDFFGTMFGYGQITVETPGEQDNYIFSMLPNPDAAAREIVAAHENFEAALESGRMPTTLKAAQPKAPDIDPEQYEQFLQYQQMVAKQQASAGSATAQHEENDPTKQT